MVIFVRRDDHRVDLGPLDQLFVAGGLEVGIRVGCQLLAQVVLDIAQTEPADAGIVAGEFRADTANRAATDHRQADCFLLVAHFDTLHCARFWTRLFGRSPALFGC